jgi:hypothetical protein
MIQNATSEQRELVAKYTDSCNSLLCRRYATAMVGGDHSMTAIFPGNAAPSL